MVQDSRCTCRVTHRSLLSAPRNIANADAKGIVPRKSIHRQQSSTMISHCSSGIPPLTTRYMYISHYQPILLAITNLYYQPLSMDDVLPSSGSQTWVSPNSCEPESHTRHEDQRSNKHGSRTQECIGFSIPITSMVWSADLQIYMLEV